MIPGLALSLAAALGFSQEPVALTIDEAVRIGVTRGFTIQTAESVARRSRARVREAQGSLGPTLTVSGTYTRFLQAPTFTGGGQGGSGGAGRIDSKQLQFQAALPIDISGVGRAAIAAARFSESAAREAILAEINNVRANVRFAYFAVLRGEELVRVAQRDEQAAKERLNRGRLQEREGTLAPFDVIRLQTDYFRAQNALTAAENEVARAKNELNLAMSRPIETPLVVQPVAGRPAVPADAEAVVKGALATRPEVRAGENTILALENIARSEQRGTLPSLSLGAVHTRNLNPSAFQQRSSTFGTAAITWPVFDSGVTRARVAQAREDQRQAEIALESLKLNVSLQVRQALVRLNSANEQLRLTEQQIVQADEALRLAQLRYDLGQGILLDVLTAQAEATRARTDNANALYEFWTAYSQLQQAAGQDTVEQPATGGSR